MLTVAALDRIGEIYFLQARYDEAVIEWKEAINRKYECFPEQPAGGMDRKGPLP